MKYLIWSKKRSGDGVTAWWNPDSAGYTTDIATAGRFHQAEAMQIQKESRGASFAISEKDIAKLRTRTIVDLGDGENWRILGQLTNAAE